MNKQKPYAGLWANLAPDGLSIEMACDNEHNDHTELWQVPFANCIAVQERFYCACYGLRPFVTGFQLNARICAMKKIPVTSATDVAKLFGLATQFAAAIQGEPVDDSHTGIQARIYIWDTVEMSLMLYADGELERLKPGVYAAGFTAESLDFLASARDAHTCFENLRQKLAATGDYQLADWPTVRATFTSSGERHWMHQGFGGEVADELAETLATLIRELLSGD